VIAPCNTTIPYIRVGQKRRSGFQYVRLTLNGWWTSDLFSAYLGVITSVGQGKAVLVDALFKGEYAFSVM